MNDVRRWLAGWLGYLADRVWPHYSERVRQGLEPVTEEQAIARLTAGAKAFIRAQEALSKNCICRYRAGKELELPWADD